MINQFTLFEESKSVASDKTTFTGKELATIGANLALESADKAVEKWSEQAYTLLLKYLAERGSGFQFQGEQARMYCEANGLPEPCSKRAYGGLVMKLARKGLIKRIGFKAVTNYRAHATPSSLWEIC